MHDGIALLVCAWIGQIDRLERQPHCLGLLLKHFQSCAVHGHALISLIHHGKQAQKLNPRVLLDEVKRPRTVLAATPAQ